MDFEYFACSHNLMPKQELTENVKLTLCNNHVKKIEHNLTIMEES